MQFPVAVGDEVRFVQVRFAEQADVEVIRSWPTLPVVGDAMPVLDAAEYAGLAAGKWDYAREKARLASSLGDLRAMIGREPSAEVIAMLVACADWHRPAPQLGFCLLRRTWVHNLFVDFLGRDPRLLRTRAANIRGIATGLLYAVMEIGRKLDAGRCLIEATGQSFRFYRKKFRLMEINDLFALTPAEQWHFMEKTSGEWYSVKAPVRLELELEPDDA